MVFKKFFKVTFYSKPATKRSLDDSWLKPNFSIDGGDYGFNGLSREQINSYRNIEVTSGIDLVLLFHFIQIYQK